MMQWTMQQVATLRHLYQHHTLRQIEPIMNIPYDKLKSATKRYRITCGRNSHFKNGHHSWNKGTSMRMSPRTEYPKGHVPHNTTHDGAVRLRSKHNGEKYYFIRISKGKWKLYHRHVWEKVHGPIAPDSCIRFRDGNSLNCELDNLMLITRRQNAMMNHNQRKSAETLTKLYQKQRLRIKYGMGPSTALGARLKNIY